MDVMLSAAVRTAVLPSVEACAEPVPIGPAKANTNAPANVTNNLRIISLQPWFELYAFQTSATYQSVVPPNSFRMVGACGYCGEGCEPPSREAFGWPKRGLIALQSAINCGSTCGRGLLARGGCGAPCIIGLMQSTLRPAPSRAAPRANPALSQAAAICPHGP